MIDDDPHIQTNNQQWWQMSSAEIADTLKTDPEEGLSRAEAQERLTKNGRNELTAKKKIQFYSFH
ncbi:cation-transporting P-type ATPase [Paucilactobacillus hokkaidonensis]|uniref:cation-transporting P-type ATPase n=1 Tax=Paucilactobacillus hokkaidonensis TaxID=1193095 RepID=UPI000A63FDD6|nr:cation-transporting P-type ATPase [Paucilactobacillus hokkaidonensis]